MSITANKNNALQELSAVSANVGGTLRSLQKIHANVNGELRELFSAGGETTTEATVTLSGARLSNNQISASSSYTNGVATATQTATISLIKAGCTVYAWGSGVTTGTKCSAGFGVFFYDVSGTEYKQIGIGNGLTSSPTAFLLTQDSTFKITAGSGGAGTSDATGAYASGGFYIVNASGDRVILTT